MDRGFPRHRATLNAATYGWFVIERGQAILVSIDGDRWTQNEYEILQGWWGFDEEGTEKLPRPMVWDEGGNVVVQGDHVAIWPFRQGGRQVLVGGTVRSVRHNEFFHKLHSEDGASVNRWAARLRPLGAAGDALGLIEVEGAADDDGTLRVRTSDGTILVIQPIDGEEGPRFTLNDAGVTIDNADVRITGGSLTVSGDASVGGDLSVSGSATVQGSLTVGNPALAYPLTKYTFAEALAAVIAEWQGLGLITGATTAAFLTNIAPTYLFRADDSRST